MDESKSFDVVFAGKKGTVDFLQKLRLAFRKWLPHLFCHDESLQFVDVVGYASAVCYGLVIPFCLVYLYAKQHALLRPGRATVAAAVHQEALEVRLVELKGSSWATC